MGVGRIVAQRLRYRRQVLSTPADHHAVSLGPGADGDLVEALKRGDSAGLYVALEAAITYLVCHAHRAHLALDRQTGRSQLGLEPCFEMMR
jgi:hypothetical protein